MEASGWRAPRTTGTIFMQTDGFSSELDMKTVDFSSRLSRKSVITLSKSRQLNKTPKSKSSTGSLLKGDSLMTTSLDDSLYLILVLPFGGSGIWVITWETKHSIGICIFFLDILCNPASNLAKYWAKAELISKPGLWASWKTLVQLLWTRERYYKTWPSFPCWVVLMREALVQPRNQKDFFIHLHSEVLWVSRSLIDLLIYL